MRFLIHRIRLRWFAALTALVTLTSLFTAASASAQALSLCGNTGTPPPVQHVIVVVLENLSYSQVVGSTNSPFQTSLASTCGVAPDYFGATHTSAANYLGISAGQYPSTAPPGCGSVSACSTSQDNLYDQLTKANLSWRAYIESMPSNCYPKSSGGNTKAHDLYSVGHNPVVFYTDIPAATCQADDVAVPSLTASSGQFYTDLQNQTLPSFSMVIPNTVDDGEGPGSKAQNQQTSDNWLQNFIGVVKGSPSYQAGNTLLLVTYDEGSAFYSDYAVGENCASQSADLPLNSKGLSPQESCHVPTFVIYPHTPAGDADPTFFTHYSITRTVEDIFRLADLANAASANSMIGHFGIPAASTPPRVTACPSPPAGDSELSGNVSVESGQTGWTGIYNSTSSVTRVMPSGGSYAVEVAPTSGNSGTAGVNNANPVWVTNTTAGQTYTGSVFVNPSVIGEKITLVLRETTPGGAAVSSGKTTITAASGWQQITAAYTAENSGDYLRYSVYASNFASSSQNFLADCLSLWTPTA